MILFSRVPEAVNIAELLLDELPLDEDADLERTSLVDFMSDAGGVGSCLSYAFVGEEFSDLLSAVIADKRDTSCSEDTSRSGC